MEQVAFDYMTEAKKTASPFFHTEKVNPADLYTAMRNAIRALDIVDKMRKALFYENREYDSGHIEIPGVTDSREYPDLDPQVIHGILGAACEGGEKLDILVRVMDGEPFDVVNYGEEVGDGWWYDVNGLHTLGLSVEQVMRANIDKLQKARMKGKTEGFDKTAFNERDLLTERATLEAGLTPTTKGDKVRVQKDG